MDLFLLLKHTIKICFPALLHATFWFIFWHQFGPVYPFFFQGLAQGQIEAILFARIRNCFRFLFSVSVSVYFFLLNCWQRCCEEIFQIFHIDFYFEKMSHLISSPYWWVPTFFLVFWQILKILAHDEFHTLMMQVFLFLF